MSRPHATPRTLRVGYMPLVDCAPLVAAVRLGLDRRHGLQLELLRQGSWAAVRDKLLSGELDAAHALAGMVYGIETGIGGPRGQMAVLMVLNQNGQAIVLEPDAARRLRGGAGLREALLLPGRVPRLAQTFRGQLGVTASGVPTIHRQRRLAVAQQDEPGRRTPLPLPGRRLLAHSCQIPDSAVRTRIAPHSSQRMTSSDSAALIDAIVPRSSSIRQAPQRRARRSPAPIRPLARCLS